MKGCDVVLCFMQEYVVHKETEMPENPTANDKRVWDYHMADIVKIYEF